MEKKTGVKKEEVKLPPPTKFTIINFGKTGHGKSSILNKLLGQKGAFKEGESYKSTTFKVDWKVGEFKQTGEKCLFVDTPGFYDTEGRDKDHLAEMINFLRVISEGFTIFLYSFSLTEMKFDISLQLSMQMLGTLLGKEVYKHTRLVLTHKNNLSPNFFNTQFAKANEELPELLQAANIEIPKPFFVYDHDLNDGGLGDLINLVISRKEKVKPDLLNMVQDNINIDDPVEMYRLLLENSKQMKDYSEKVAKMEKVIEELRQQKKLLEKDREDMKAALEKVEDQKEEMRQQMEQAKEENKKFYQDQINEFNKQMDAIKDSHKTTLLTLQEQMKAQQQAHEKNIEEINKSMIKQREDWEEKEREYITAIQQKPAEIHHYHESGGGGCLIV